MIDFTTPTPLRDAIAQLSARTPLGSAMKSKQWERTALEIRDAAFFSATVEDERILANMQAKIMQRLKLARSADAAEVTMDRSRFIAEMQDELKVAGYKPEPKKRGTIEDVSSAGRLGLIWDMQLAMAQGYAQWQAGMDADILEAFPVRELVRDERRVEPRDWPMIWAKNGGKFYGKPGTDYPDAPGRMMALASDPIWAKISRFGKPWPPFDWGSGMGLRKIRAREAAAMGLVPPVKPPEDPKPKPEPEPAKPAEAVKPLDVSLSKGMKASLKGIPEAGRERLRSTFGDAVEMTEDDITLVHESEELTIPESLAARSRRTASTKVIAQEPQETAAAITAVAVGRRALASVVIIGAISVPRGVESVEIEGVTHLFRPDVTGLSAATVRALPDKGRALLNGLADPNDRTAVELVIEGPAGAKVTLKVPAASSMVWAQARLRDFTLAFGSGWSAKVGGKVVPL